MPWTVLSALYFLTQIQFSRHYRSHCIIEDSEALTDWITCPRSHSYSRAVLGFNPRWSGTSACVLEPLYAQGLHRFRAQSQASPGLPLHSSCKASRSSMPGKGKPFGYWLCLIGSQSSFPKYHLCLAHQPLSEICKMGRDGVKIEHFPKALFYCSEIPAVSGAQFNGGERELPQVPQASWASLWAKAHREVAFIRAVLCPGVCGVFSSLERKQLALLQPSLRTSIQVDRAGRWGTPRCLWKGNVSKIDDSMISSEIISKIIDYVTKS